MTPPPLWVPPWVWRCLRCSPPELLDRQPVILYPGRQIYHWETFSPGTNPSLDIKLQVEFQRPILKNLKMIGSTWNCIQCFKIWADAQLEPLFRFKFFDLGLRPFFSMRHTFLISGYSIHSWLNDILKSANGLFI